MQSVPGGVCPDDGRARVGLDGPHRPPEQTPQCAPAFALDTRMLIMPCENEQQINDVRFARPFDSKPEAELEETTGLDPNATRSR
jgi:hypothetical protein